MMQETLSFPWQMAGSYLTYLIIFMGLYMFLLNVRRGTNRVSGLVILLLGVNSILWMLVMGGVPSFTKSENQSSLTLAILAAAAPSTGPALILASLCLMKPKWLRGRQIWLVGTIGILILIPWILTLVDLLSGSQLYLMKSVSANFSGTNLEPTQVVTGLTGVIIWQGGIVYTRILLILLMVYLSFFDRKLDSRLRSLAKILLSTVLLAWILEIFLEDIIPTGMAAIIFAAIIGLGYSVVTYREMYISNYLPSGRVRLRLSAMIAGISIPLIVLVAWFIVGQAGALIEEESTAHLNQQALSLQVEVDHFIQNYVTDLQNLSHQPDILSMDPAEQKPILQATALSYPYIYLVSTTDLSGMNLARNDDSDLLDYSDRDWFQRVVGGADIVLQTLVGRTTGQPALVAAVPIKDNNGEVLGVCMFASLLTEISQQVLAVNIGETGFAYMVDEQDQLIAHPDLLPGGSQLINWGEAAPVVSLRQETAPPLEYVDQQGIGWIASYAPLSNGWGVIVQQERSEVMTPIHALQSMTIGQTAVAGAVLLVLVGLTVRQTIRPVESLTQVIKGVGSGDLSLVAQVESEDEFGALARGFNSLTMQVRTLVDGLEKRVAERTLDVEHRSAQLQAAAQVGRAAANIRDMDELLPLITRLISERFGFYHVGVFLLDEKQEYAVLRAANSEGGQRMLARGHRLQVGQQGIVGYVCHHHQPRIALNVGEDAVYFSNPDLPDTQSEMALPLIVGNNLLGALDVQSTEPAAFSEQDIRTLQVLADQVAIAINSARLVQQLEQVLEAERRAYGEISRQTWLQQTHSQAYRGFSRTSGGVVPIMRQGTPPEALPPWWEEDDGNGSPQEPRASVDPDAPTVLYVPLKVRQVVIGVLKLTRQQQINSASVGSIGDSRPPLSGSWTEDDIQLMENLAEQLGVALESARAYQSTQADAQRDRLLAEINTRLRERLDVEAILRTTSQELRRALNLSKVVVQLIPETDGIEVDGQHATDQGDDHE